MHVFESKIVQTRKKHVCYGCCSDIKIGYKTKVTKTAYEGKIYATYWCEFCDAFMNDKNNLLDFEDDITFGELKQESNYETFKEKNFKLTRNTIFEKDINKLKWQLL